MSNFIIALTGGIGSGKTTVAKMFAELKIPVIDADEIAHELTNPNTPFFRKIVSHFDQNILKHDGTLNREKLGKIVFHDPHEKQWLEDLLHPTILEQLFDRAKKAKSPYVVLVIPLLLEALKKEGNFVAWIQKHITRILVVQCEFSLQEARVKARGQIDSKTIDKIVESQATPSERAALADDIMTNNGSLDHLQKQVQKLHEKYLALFASK